MSSMEHKQYRQKRASKISKDFTSSNDNRNCVIGKEKSKTNCGEVRMANKDVLSASCYSLPEYISSNFVFTQPELSSDIGNMVNVDDWFKQRTESVSSMDLDASMKSECMDVNYLGDSIECIDSNNLLSTKDSVDMCLVTNICDIGLELDMPNITSCDKTFVGINDQDINEPNILNDYNPDHESLLLSLEEDDLLDKDDISAEGIAECMSSRSQSPVNQSKSAGESCTSVEPLDLDEDTFTLSNSIASMSPPEIEETIEKCGDEDYWVDHLEMPESIEVLPVARGNKNSNKIWDGLPIHRRSEYLTTERDFLDLNDFLSLQTDTDEDVASGPSETLPSKSQSDAESKNGCSNVSEFNNDKDEASFIVPISINGQVADVIVRGEKPPSGCLRKTNGAAPHAPSTKSRSVLKRNVWGKKPTTSLEAQSSAVMFVPLGPPEKPRTPPKITRTRALPISEPPSKAGPVNPMAIIAISTNKAKKTTEVVINTSQGEHVFKGKTSEFMKAKACASQARTLRVRDDLTNTACDKVVQSGRNVADKVGVVQDSDQDNTKLFCKPAVKEDDACGNEDPDGTKEAAAVVDALSEVGITDDSLLRVLTATGEKVWACPVHECNTFYIKLTKLRLHLLGHYGIRPFKCDFLGCEWSFYKYFKLRRHKETHEKRKSFKCTVEACERTFTTVYNLKTHIKLHERPAEVLCKVAGCTARFQTKRKLEVHLKNHDPAFAPYKCRFKGCGKSYYSANAITSHCRSHQHSEDELRCQFCNKLYDKPCRLRFHMRSHTGDKPFSCSFDGCSWAFTSSSKLKRHMFKHTNERKFVCSVKNCGKSFMRTEHLKEHILTHSSARCFACPIENCTGRFQARSSLYSHLKKHRARNAQEKKPKKGQSQHCPITGCSKLYGNSYTLRKHVLKVHAVVTPKTDAPPMDYIAMLDEVDDMAVIDGLQFASDLPAAAAGEAETVTEMSKASSPPPELISSDFINTSFEFQSILLPKRDNSGIVPTALGLVTSPEKQTTRESVATVRRLDNKGCARTSCTLGEIAAMRARKAAGVEVALDSTMLGTHDITHSLLMQEELGTGQFLYQDEAMLASGTEYEVLLDQAEGIDVKFAASTINLRDLE